MELMIALVMAAALCGGVVPLDTIDTFQPILRLSPALGDPDRFGFSVAVHQRSENATLLGHREALEDAM